MLRRSPALVASSSPSPRRRAEGTLPHPQPEQELEGCHRVERVLNTKVCYLLSMRWVFLEEETVMQQSSVSISLSFLEPRYQSSRRQHTSHLVPAQTIKNLATNAIKGLSIPSQSLAKVRSDRDNKINIFDILLYRLKSKDCKIK